MTNDTSTLRSYYAMKKVKKLAQKSVRPLALLVCASFLVGCSNLSVLGETQPVPKSVDTKALKRVELPNTEVHELPADDTGRKYQVWVYLPPSYAQADKPMPVVFTTDTPYAFPLIRSIGSLVGARGQNIEPFILVGLSYEPDLPPGDSRSRDYTPTNPLMDAARNPKHYSASTYGQAAVYRDYIERQVFPLIAKNYRADMSRKVYIGQSYGGLFGAFTLVTKPELFHTYLLGSPSLWFDKRSIWSFESDYAKKRNDLKARVKIYTGSFETIKPEPRYTKEFDLLQDMFDFEKKLMVRGYPSLSINAEIVVDEDHRTMGPTFITRGLLWALPGRGPYTAD